jgi:hypothetical protein
METRNSLVLKSFVSYCKAHPEERFWQALRNWSGQNFVLTANSITFKTQPKGDEITYNDKEDTFYWEGRYRGTI